MLPLESPMRIPTYPFNDSTGLNASEDSPLCLSLSLALSLSQSCRMVSMVLYFYYITMIIYILYYLVFKILSSLVRDSSYHHMYYKGCGLLCAHKKSFNTAIPVRSLGPYMYVHYCTCIVHILVWTYLFLLTSFFDCLSFCGLFLKHPYKRFFPFYILYFYLSRSLSLSLSRSLSHCLCVSFTHTNSFCFIFPLLRWT